MDTGEVYIMPDILESVDHNSLPRDDLGLQD